MKAIQDKGKQFLGILLLKPIKPRSTSPHSELEEEGGRERGREGGREGG